MLSLGQLNTEWRNTEFCQKSSPPLVCGVLKEMIAKSLPDSGKMSHSDWAIFLFVFLCGVTGVQSAKYEQKKLGEIYL